MMRGDLVTIAMQGDFGKPRPALVIQANQFSEHSSVTVLPITSTMVAAPLLRITVNQRRNLNRCQRPILNSFRGGESGAVCSGRSRSLSR